jgi:hypothetical protein
MRRCNGTQFDPEVLSAFVNAIDTGAITLAAISVSGDYPAVGRLT